MACACSAAVAVTNRSPTGRMLLGSLQPRRWKPSGAGMGSCCRRRLPFMRAFGRWGGLPPTLALVRPRPPSQDALVPPLRDLRLPRLHPRPARRTRRIRPTGRSQPAASETQPQTQHELSNLTPFIGQNGLFRSTCRQAPYVRVRVRRVAVLEQQRLQQPDRAGSQSWCSREQKAAVSHGDARDAVRRGWPWRCETAGDPPAHPAHLRMQRTKVNRQVTTRTRANNKFPSRS